MDSLLEEACTIMDTMEPQRITTICKLLMISARHWISLAKFHHCRLLFGLPNDFHDRVRKYLDFFCITIDPNGLHVLELMEWDPMLAVKALEHDFVPDEAQVWKTFKFTILHGKSLPLKEEDERRLNSLTTLPLVSPYYDGSEQKPWSLEAEN